MKIYQFNTIEKKKIILEGIRYIDEMILYDAEKDLYDLLLDLNQSLIQRELQKNLLE